MGLFIRRPRIIPGPIGYRSSRRKGGGGGCLFWFLALALLGGAFSVSPILGWLVLAAIPVAAVAGLVLYLMPSRPAKAGHARPAKPDAEWKAEHVPASAEYKAAHPEGPRDWEPAS